MVPPPRHSPLLPPTPKAEHLETRVLALQKTMHEQMEQHRGAQAQAQAETQKAERLLGKMNESMNESSGTLHAQLARERTRAEHLGRQVRPCPGLRTSKGHMGCPPIVASVSLPNPAYCLTWQPPWIPRECGTGLFAPASRLGGCHQCVSNNAHQMDRPKVPIP